jgi:hypothetical protein
VKHLHSVGELVDTVEHEGAGIDAKADFLRAAAGRREAATSDYAQ